MLCYSVNYNKKKSALPTMWQIIDREKAKDIVFLVHWEREKNSDTDAARSKLCVTTNRPWNMGDEGIETVAYRKSITGKVNEKATKWWDTIEQWFKGNNKQTYTQGDRNLSIKKTYLFT